MKLAAAILTLMSAVVFAAPTAVLAQVNLDGRSTPAELLQIRRAVDRYVDNIKEDHFRSVDIDWEMADVTRDDIDGKPGLEALVHITGPTICGASACDNAIVTWRNGAAKIITVVNDASLSVLPTKSHGLHDLSGHYWSYRWKGKEYVQYCRPAENACN